MKNFTNRKKEEFLRKKLTIMTRQQVNAAVYAAVVAGCGFLAGCTDNPVRETLFPTASSTRSADASAYQSNQTENSTVYQNASYQGSGYQSSGYQSSGYQSAVYTPVNQKRKVALVIGNSSYENVSPLKNPSNDAHDLADALRKMGFEVDEELNVNDQHSMRDTVARFGDKLRKGGGIGLFYYSGHGMQVKGENYLIPVKANLRQEADIEYEALGVKYVLSTLDEAQNGMNIVILDACRDNPFARSMRMSSRSVPNQGLAQVDSVSGSLIAFSTSPGNTAEDGSGRNGTYTKNLLTHLNDPGIGVETLFKRVRVGVSQDTNKQQIPWESSSLTGEFCFSGCTDPTVTQRESELKKELARQQAAAADAERRRIDAEKALQQSETGKANAEFSLSAQRDVERNTPPPKSQPNLEMEAEMNRLRAENEEAKRKAAEMQAAAEQARMQETSAPAPASNAPDPSPAHTGFSM